MSKGTKVISKRKYKKMSPKERRLLWWKVNGKKVAGIFIATATVVAIVVGIVLTVEPKNNNANNNPQLSVSLNNIIYIGSTSCEPCKLLKPVLADIEADYSSQVKVTFYDSWNTTLGAQKANEYGIQTIPTLIFVDKNGNELHRLQGYNTYGVVENNLRSLGWI